MEISLQGLFEWFQTQAKYGLFIILLVVVLWFASKRAWIALIGAVVGLTVVGMFILNPDIISDLAEWFGGLINIAD